MTSPTVLPSAERLASGRLVAADGRTLPLRATSLEVTAKGGLARTLLRQTFANPWPEPLAVVYQLPLPADGAVSGFAFHLGDRTVRGVVDGRAAARERYEQALAEGRTAALLEQDRTALFHQEVGNLPPGAEVIAEIEVDQLLRWQDGGEWEYRFPTTVAPRYLGAEPGVADAARQQVDVLATAVPPRLQCAIALAERPTAGPTSPSHAVQCTPDGDGVRVAFADPAGAGLDRDVVLRWRASGADIGASLETARPAAGRAHADHAYGLLTVVPPLVPAPSVPRDVHVLLDTSGSMLGAPLAQAKAVVAAVIDSLGEQDLLSMTAFADQPRAFGRAPAAATGKLRARAHRWLQALQAGGGTEMATAIEAALQAARERRQRQILLVTDGAIGAEAELVSRVRIHLPAGCRCHTLGVGAAPNRTLTAGLARAGRGTESLVALGEDPAAAARRCAAAMGAPQVVDLQVGGSAVVACAPIALPDLHAGAPARIALRLRPEGGTLRITGTTATGPWSHERAVLPTGCGAGRGAVVVHFGREHVEDLELQIAAGEVVPDLEAAIEAVGLQFQIATRLTSWLAVGDAATVDPQAPIRRLRVPHELPAGMSLRGLGLRPAHGLKMRRIVERPQGAFEVESPIVRRRVKSPPPVAEIRGLTAVLKARAGRLLWFEIEACDLPGDLWQLPTMARLRWDDGTVVDLVVEVGRTTRPGAVADGTWVRLCVRAGRTCPDSDPSELLLDRATFDIRSVIGRP